MNIIIIILGRLPAQGRGRPGACRLLLMDLTMGPLLDVEGERDEDIAADGDYDAYGRVRRRAVFIH